MQFFNETDAFIWNTPFGGLPDNTFGETQDFANPLGFDGLVEDTATFAEPIPWGMVIDPNELFFIKEGDNTANTITGDHNREIIRGHKGNDHLSGKGNNDRLFGGDGNDTLDGGDGEDTLSGGWGQDQLTGGSDADIFVFEDADMTRETAPDTITDFQLGVDKIDLSGAFRGTSNPIINAGSDLDGATNGISINTFEGKTYIDIHVFAATTLIGMGQTILDGVYSPVNLADDIIL
ncbi:MAG: M10 family metallopeptidase C-terminal domain-containing protein [Pseudomonadota bacterium]